MSTYQLTHLQRVSGIGIVTTLQDAYFDLGATVTIAGVDPTFNGTYTIIALPQAMITGLNTFGDFIYNENYPIANQFAFNCAGDDEARQRCAGTITDTTPQVTWIESQDASTWLGFEPGNQNDYEFLESCTQAANEFCYRRRHEAGYQDDILVAPNDAVKLGTVMYAAILYRERGAVDGFASFDGMGGGGAPTMTLGRVLQLLGCNRSQVA